MGPKFERARTAGEQLPAPETETTERFALISVSDKAGVADFARVLDSLGYRIISTGGTARTLTASGIDVVPIQEVTGNPEAFDGRMKTISFPIESGILFDRTNPSHVREAQELNVRPIDIVVCNLYPFEQTIQNPNVTLEEAVENIDVGGPTMIRAAAKNFASVLVVTDPQDYQRVGEVLSQGTVTQDFRRELAAKAFRLLSSYDSKIASFLG